MAEIKSIMQRKKAKLSQKQRERTKKTKSNRNEGRDSTKKHGDPKKTGLEEKQPRYIKQQNRNFSEVGWGEAWATAGNFCNNYSSFNSSNTYIVEKFWKVRQNKRDRDSVCERKRYSEEGTGQKRRKRGREKARGDYI